MRYSAVFLVLPIIPPLGDNITNLHGMQIHGYAVAYAEKLLS